MAAVSRKPIYTNKALLSPDELKKAGIEVNEIGPSPMLWPKDYSDIPIMSFLTDPTDAVNPGYRGRQPYLLLKPTRFFIPNMD